MSRIEVWVIGQGGALHYGGTFFSWHTVLASLAVDLFDGGKTRWEIYPVGHPYAIQLVIVLR